MLWRNEEPFYNTYCNVAEYPTAEWTIHQLREAIPAEHEYRFLIRDRDFKGL